MFQFSFQLALLRQTLPRVFLAFRRRWLRLVTLEAAARWHRRATLSAPPFFDYAEQPLLGDFKIRFQDRFIGAREGIPRARVDQPRREGLLEKITHHEQGIVAAFAPIIAAHRDP